MSRHPPSVLATGFLTMALMAAVAVWKLVQWVWG